MVVQMQIRGVAMAVEQRQMVTIGMELLEVSVEAEPSAAEPQDLREQAVVVGVGWTELHQLQRVMAAVEAPDTRMDYRLLQC